MTAKSVDDSRWLLAPDGPTAVFVGRMEELDAARSDIALYTFADPSVVLLKRKAKLVFADPPYNIGIDYGRGARHDRRRRKDFIAQLEQWIAAAVRWMSDDALIAWMISEEYAYECERELRKHKLRKVQRVVWHETFHTYRETGFPTAHRHILLFTNGNPEFHAERVRVRSIRQNLRDKRSNSQGRVPGSVWEFPRVHGKSADRVSWHPAQLPLGLLERLVRAYTDDGDVVADPFVGSGTTAVAAIRQGRSFFGSELNSEYARKAVSRLKGAAGLLT